MTEIKDIGWIVDGVVTMVWLDTTTDAVISTLPAGDYDLVEFDLGGVRCGQLWDGEALTNPPLPPAPAAPAEVAMHKVEKAALLMPWPGFDNLATAIEHGISQLPAPSNALAMIEWKRAPNLQREGLTTLAVMDLIGMSAEQRDELLNFANSLA